ncbi:MAG: sulfate ABC transporter ATP-binding protein [Planctomycetota bacterium]|nr:MAG: sulfate ABC transporter ATP-binding protein [Planctomycetota bacterium]
MRIEIESIGKRFGAAQVLTDVDLYVPSGELVALLGPSGSGKTTLLRVIAGLESADGGRVLFDGEDVTERHVGERGVGFVFQHYALFRHMTVTENVAFGLRVRPRRERIADSEIRARVAELLELVQLSAYANRYPSQLSGGQRQRIALARALAVRPRVLLLDEPFGALDAQVRVELRRWLRRLHDEIHVTSVFVTHDQEEALEVADRVVVMNQGRVEQVGSPDDIYHHPATPFVYRFLGNVNLFGARLEGGRPRLTGETLAARDAAPGAGACAYVRPHRLDLSRQPRGGDALEATVAHVHAAGPVVRIEVSDRAQRPVRIELSHERFRELRVKSGDRVWVVPREIHVYTD